MERSTLIEWWGTRSADGEHTGRWYETGDLAAARALALDVVDAAWTARVRVTALDDGQPVAAVDADRASLFAWNVTISSMPANVEGPPLPPRSPDDIRREVFCGCRDALVLGLRAGLIDRRRVLDLLHEVDRSFDPGMLDDDDDGD